MLDFATCTDLSARLEVSAKFLTTAAPVTPSGFNIFEWVTWQPFTMVLFYSTPMDPVTARTVREYSDAAQTLRAMAQRFASAQPGGGAEGAAPAPAAAVLSKFAPLSTTEGL